MDPITQHITQSIERSALLAAKEWLTIDEACHFANCSKHKLSKLIDLGEIEASHRGIKGQTVSVSKSSINAWHQRHKYNPNAWKK